MRPRDIAHFVTEALVTPSAWAGRAVDLAGDELTVAQAATVFARVTGSAVTYQQMTAHDRAGLSPDSAAMWTWLDRNHPA